jgi:hypothetical protein
MHCPRILSVAEYIMTSVDEEKEERNLPHRHMEMNAVPQEIYESIGNMTSTSLAQEEEVKQQQDGNTNMEDITKACSLSSSLSNPTNTETLENVPIINDITLSNESNCFECNEMEGPRNITREATKYVSVLKGGPATQGAAVMCERKEYLDNTHNFATCEGLYATLKREACERNKKVDKTNYKKHEINIRRESLTENIKYSSDDLHNEYSNMIIQPVSSPNVKRLQETNQTRVRHSFTSLENIQEEVNSTLGSHCDGANHTVSNNAVISKSRKETEESPLKILLNTVGVTTVSDHDSQSQTMEGNELRDKPNLVLLRDSMLVNENIHQVTTQPSEKVAGSDNNITAGSDGKILWTTENKNNEFQFHGESEDAEKEKIIFNPQINDETADSITTTQRLKRSSEVHDSFVMLTSSNENNATNELKYLEEHENSTNMVRDFEKLKFCRNVISDIRKYTSPRSLLNMNAEFKGVSNYFQGKESVNMDKRMITYQSQKAKPARISNTTITLTTFYIPQCEEFMPIRINNENDIATFEEWSITEGHPVAHSSHMDRVTNIMPQITSHRPTSRAISFPHPDVITTDADILRPLAAQEIDPGVRLQETGPANELSNKDDKLFDNVTKNVNESLFHTNSDTERLKGPVLVTESTGTQYKSLQDTAVTAYYKDDACKIKESYIIIRGNEAEFQEINSANSASFITAETCTGSMYKNDEYKVSYPADYSVKNITEFKLSDEMRNGATITESTATTCIKADLMKRRSNVQNLLTFDCTDGFPEFMQSTQKKEYWDNKLMKHTDVTVQRDRHDAGRVERSAAHDSKKVPIFYNRIISHPSTEDRRLISVRNTGVVNKCKQVFDKTVSINKTCSEVVPNRNQWECRNQCTCNENVVAQCRTCSGGTPEVSSKCSKYEITNVAGQKLTKASGAAMTRIVHFEEKSSVCDNQKDADLYASADEVISVDDLHNAEITEHDIKSPSGITTNFSNITSFMLLSNMTLHKPSNIIFDEEIYSCFKTVNISIETGQQKEELANDTTNKELQGLNGNGINIIPTEVDDCDLSNTGTEKFQGSENKTYRAMLVYVTDDGYIIPKLKTMLLLTSQSTPINNNNFQVESHNRPEFCIEHNAVIQHTEEESIPNSHDDNHILHQAISSEGTEQCVRRWTSKKDARTERKLRFQRAKLFFQRYEQNELDKSQI